MDTVDKLYLISEQANDDLYKVALIMKKCGCKNRPSRIVKNLENLAIKDYVVFFDRIIVELKVKDAT